MNPLRQDDPRHEQAVKALDAAARCSHRFNCEACGEGAERVCPYNGVTPWDEHKASAVIAAYHESLKEQGVVLIEAYAGDDTMNVAQEPS